MSRTFTYIYLKIKPVITSLNREMINITMFRKMLDVIIFCKLSHWKKQNYLWIKYNTCTQYVQDCQNQLSGFLETTLET